MSSPGPAIERFLKQAVKPALLEPGEPLLPLHHDNVMWDSQPSHLLLQAWDEHRNIVRRVTQVRHESRGKLTLSVRKFAGREGELILMDLAAPRVQEFERRGSRLVFRERFRQLLSRGFPDWEITELSTEADLAHTLSPVFPRALLRRGHSGMAAISAGPEVADTSPILTFGLIWLDHLRRRERGLTVEGLVIFLPASREKPTSLRVRLLRPDVARFEIFTYSEEDFACRLDPSDFGNVDTVLEASAPAARRFNGPEAWLESLVRAHPEEIDAGLRRTPVYGQVPAFAGGQRGIIDLLAVEHSGRLAVLELKASADLHLPLQALDYWMRVVWHLERRELGAYFPGVDLAPDPPRLFLIAPALEFHPASETVLAFFSPKIEVVRIGLAADWRNTLRVMFRLRNAERP